MIYVCRFYNGNCELSTNIILLRNIVDCDNNFSSMCTAVTDPKTTPISKRIEENVVNNILFEIIVTTWTFAAVNNTRKYIYYIFMKLMCM